MALLAPTLAPAVVTEEAPLDAVEPAMTTAPVGLPVTKVGVVAWMSAGTDAEEEEAGAGEADAGGVEQVRREDVLLLNA